LPRCIWAKEQLSDGQMENYLAAASSDKELDKDVLCHHSPLLFNLHIQYVINEALDDTQERVKVGGVLIPAIRFADNQAMVSRTVRGLQVIMDALQDTSQK